ncbi:MAG: hypothetical protein HQK76_12000 [Desulfobacterales bacterium]|nr:hypothetical protein [Desulfobacterales bacterium]
MGFKSFVKNMFSTGQKSVVTEADCLYKEGDIKGAVKVLDEALKIRVDLGKLRGVIEERHKVYFKELCTQEISECRQALEETAFELPNFAKIEKIISDMDRKITQGQYSGENRKLAEEVYKSYNPQFKQLSKKQKEIKYQEIIAQIKNLDPQASADKFVMLVDDLKSQGGALPKDLLDVYKKAQESSYIVNDDLKEFAGYKIKGIIRQGRFCGSI